MLIKEMRKWLKDKQVLQNETADTFETSSFTIPKRGSYITIKNHPYHGDFTSDFLAKVVEFINTPISEREDERKYAFELWHKANLSMETKYLKFDRKLELYYLNKNEVENSQFQRIFTQSEIDNFPKEIKGAIECGFLRKVEVECGMSKLKYKVGDHVRVRQWDDMVKEFGIKDNGSIQVRSDEFFITAMRDLCGKKDVISRIQGDTYCLKNDVWEWNFTDEMLEVVNE